MFDCFLYGVCFQACLFNDFWTLSQRSRPIKSKNTLYCCVKSRFGEIPKGAPRIDFCLLFAGFAGPWDDLLCFVVFCCCCCCPPYFFTFVRKATSRRRERPRMLGGYPVHALKEMRQHCSNRSRSQGELRNVYRLAQGQERWRMYIYI